MKKDNKVQDTTAKNDKPTPSQNDGTSSEETIKRGEAAIHARQAVDPRPEEVKKEEEKEDAEKWRNEG